MQPCGPFTGLQGKRSFGGGGAVLLKCSMHTSDSDTAFIYYLYGLDYVLMVQLFLNVLIVLLIWILPSGWKYMIEIEIVPILTLYPSEPYAVFSHPPTLTQTHTHTHCPV